MNSEIRQKWVDALLSGNYTQSTGRLRTSHGFCCWGVLDAISPFQPSNRCYPSQELLDWAGIDRKSGPINDIVLYLSQVNDNETSFSYIVEEIERYL